MSRRKRRTPTETPAPERSDPARGFKQSCFAIAVVLAILTIVAFAPVRHYGFVNFDDNDYVTGNPHVTNGLTPDGVVWAFTTGHAANWHPLTWISHMVDVQLYGLDPEGHHITNLVFHLANTLLLFWILVEMTGAPGPSGFVAALFAVHPLHVESVAWVAERKDVLSTFFWMLTLAAYVRFVRRPGRGRYLTVVTLFAAGLLAKPMLVTLPFVLLLLDFWPLRRWTLSERNRLPALVREKIPLMLLTIISSVVTLLAQAKGGAVIGLAKALIGSRLANVFVSYFMYAYRMIWPARLTVLYPNTANVPHWWIAAAFGVIAVSIISLRTLERWPVIAVGWFWYVGTLVPVLGLVQVGEQASADRYTYVPLIGLFLILAFGIYDALHRQPSRNFVFAGACGLTIVACVGCTRVQLGYWKTSQTLWEHALAVDNENPSAHVNVGSYLEQQGRLDDAKFHYNQALRIDHDYGIAHTNLAAVLERRGRLDDAIPHYSEAFRIGPEDAAKHFALGNALAKRGQTHELGQAIDQLGQALRLQSDFPEAHNSLGICYWTLEQSDKAIAELSAAIRLKPD